MKNIPILIVTEDGISKLILKVILKNHNCIFFTHSQEAYNYFKKERASLIILDLCRLDHKDDISHLQSIRVNMAPDLPFIALSLNIDQRLNEHLLNSCFNKVISKPFDSDELLKTITHFMIQSKITT